MKHLLLILTVFFVVSLNAENRVLHTLYTKDNGLSQNRVMAIEQDRKGFMWFATWDGLNRFDGKQFRVYKGYPGDPEGPDNNRFISVASDAFGLLWVLTGNGEVLRFNPETEQFRRLSVNPTTRTGLIKHPISRIQVLKHNVVALISIRGCYLIRINPDASLGSTTFLCSENGSLASNWVNQVIADGAGKVWLLTNSGLTYFDLNLNRSQHFFNQPGKQESFLCLLQVEGRTYFGTESGHVWYKGNGKATFKGNQVSTFPITALLVFSGNKLMMSTLGGGLYVTDSELKVVNHFTTASHPDLGSNRVHTLYTDNDGTIWLDAERNGFVYYDTQTETLHRIPLPAGFEPLASSDRPGLRVIEGKNGLLWLYARSGGLFLCDRSSKIIQPVSMTRMALGAQDLGLLTDAMVDKDGNVWISTGEPRLEKITVEPVMFRFTNVASIDKRKDGSEVRTLFEDSKKRIWVCDKEGKIQLKDRNHRILGWLRPDGTLSSTPLQTDMMVYDMIQDKKGRLWLACKGVGVVLLQEKQALSPTFTVRYLNNELSFSERPSSSLCYALLEDTKGKIWVGTFGGGLNLVKETNDSIRFLHTFNGLTSYPLNTFSNIRDLAIDYTGYIWVATDNGLLAFQADVTDPSSVHYFTYRRNGSVPGSIRTNDVHCIHIDAQNNRWFGTFGGGLNRLDATVKPGDETLFQAYTEKDGQHSDIILSIVDDQGGGLWLFSENSIIRFEAKTNTWDVYNKDYGMDPVLFAESSTLITHTGEILAGTMKGYYRFNPSKVKKAGATIPLYFTGLYVIDEEITAKSPHGILNENLDQAKRIVLKHEHTVFSIEYAALDFRNPQNIQYAYKLEPLDKEWVLVKHSNRITFSRLNPSEYTLVVRSTNSEGVWMNNERRLTIVVKPSPWQTGWALILYVIVGLCMLYVLHIRLMEKYKSSSRKKADKVVVEAKKQFLATVTRELRVPLMLMEGPVEQLSKDNGISFDSKNNLSIIRRNMERMIRLVTRILEYQKKEEHTMTLMVEKVRLGDYCAKRVESFRSQAQERGILFLFVDQSDGLEVYLDKEKFNTILHILLTNALRFTPGGKGVSLEIRHKLNGVVVVIADEGTGISKENLPFIFDHFKLSDQADNENGMGIGLSLVKELVELHGGTIQVSSQKDVGTTFELFFKPGKDHLANADLIVYQPETTSTNQTDYTVADASVSDKQHEPDKQPLFVVVEPSHGTESAIPKLLTHRFRMASINLTPQSLMEIERLMPDYVIIDNDTSTITEDGQLLIGQLKNNERTCHIPIILTAEKPVEQWGTGELPNGVDDLISKPLNAAYLDARLEQLLISRKSRQEQLLKDVLDATSKPFITSLSLEPFDGVFLGRIMDFIKEQLPNSELSAEILIAYIGLGRTPFISKLKTLLDLTPYELIRDFRLKYAMFLLESGRYNVSEVVPQIGINNVDEFNALFKKYVGMSPLEYKSKFATEQS